MSEQLNQPPQPEAPEGAVNRPPTEYMQQVEQINDLVDIDSRGMARRPENGREGWRVMTEDEARQVGNHQELIRAGLDDRAVTGEKRDAFEAAVAFAHSDEREHAAGPDVREATDLTSSKLQELGYVSYADLEKDALSWDETRQAVEEMAHPTPQPKEAWRQEADEWKEQRQAASEYVEKLVNKAKFQQGGQLALDRNPELAESLRAQAMAQAETEGYDVDHLKPRHVVIPRNEAAEDRQSDLAALLRQHDREVLTAQALKSDEDGNTGGEPTPTPEEDSEGTPQTDTPEGAITEEPAAEDGSEEPEEELTREQQAILAMADAAGDRQARADKRHEVVRNLSAGLKTVGGGLVVNIRERLQGMKERYDGWDKEKKARAWIGGLALAGVVGAGIVAANIGDDEETGKNTQRAPVPELEVVDPDVDENGEDEDKPETESEGTTFEVDSETSPGITYTIMDAAKSSNLEITPEQSYDIYKQLDARGLITKEHIKGVGLYTMENGDKGFASEGEVRYSQELMQVLMEEIEKEAKKNK